MRGIDEPALGLPFVGTGMLRDLVGLQSWQIGRKHVTTFMCRMGIEAIYRRESPRRPHPEHAMVAYLLRLGAARSVVPWRLYRSLVVSIERRPDSRAAD
jgi:hypothetical protein